MIHHINSLSFEENRILVTQVNPDFDPLEIGSTFLSFRNGAKILSHSKMTNASEFTWNEQNYNPTPYRQVR